MDPESLKTIVEILNTLGSETKEIFIWYIVATNVEPIINSSIRCGCVVACIYLVTRFFKYLVKSVCVS